MLLLLLVAVHWSSQYDVQRVVSQSERGHHQANKHKPITVTAKTLAVAKSTSQLINTKAPQVQEWKCVFDCYEGSNPLIVKRKKMAMRKLLRLILSNHFP